MRFDQDIQQQISTLFADYDRPDSPGFAVGIVHAHNVVFERGFGQASLAHLSPITRDTVFDVGSLAKQFVGMAIALLAEAGQLSINDKLQKYLPEFPTYAQEVTLAHLLYHTSGMRNYTVLTYYMMGYHQSDAPTAEEVYQLLLRLNSLNFKPGSRWEYSDSNYFLLAEIVARVTGKPFSRYAAESIFQPLAMDNTRFRDCHSQVIKNRASSYVTYPIEFRSPSDYRSSSADSDPFYTLGSNYEHIGAEGLFTTLDDLLKWDHNFTDNRLGSGGPDLIAQVLAPGARINAVVSYGYGINVGVFNGRDFYGHNGAIHGYTSSMLHFSQENVSIICLANHNVEGAWEYRNRIIELIFPSKDAVTRPPSPQRAPAENVLESQEICGRYQNPESASIWEVQYKPGKFLVKENNAHEFEIVPRAPLVYQRSGTNIQLRFEVDAQGQPCRITGEAGGQPFSFVRFLQVPPSIAQLLEYVGAYRSLELETVFIVELDGQKLSLRNKNRHFCSMDLLYAPTIKDHFIAYDPHPVSSQLEFLREAGQVVAFVYRDYDGDGRESLRFERLAPDALF